MKKIVIFVDILGGKGGTEKVINDVLVHYKDSSDFELTIINFGSVSTKKWVNKQVKQFNILPFPFIQKIKGIRKVLFIFELLLFSLLKMDTVITVHIDTLKVLAMARKINRRNFRIASWIHFGLESSQLFSSKDINTIKEYSDLFISITDENTKILLNRGYPAEKIATVYNPVKRQNRLIPSSNNKFISIGRLTFDKATEKNNKEMFDAFYLIKDLDWTLNIYGDGSDRSYEEEYVKKLGIGKNINFLGWRDYPFENITEAAAIISTSTFEGFGLSMIEGISYGIPVISTDIEGPRIFLTLNNSLTYKLGDVSVLAKILRCFIEKKIKFYPQFVNQSIESFYEDNYFLKFDLILSGGNNDSSK